MYPKELISTSGHVCKILIKTCYKMVSNTRRRIKFKNQVVVCILLILLYLFLQIINFENSTIHRNFTSSVIRHSKPKLVTILGNFELKHIELREGPGENGIPHILRLDQRKSAKQSELEFGMNIACSNEISLDRSVPDTRLEECRHWDYPTDLPSASVVIVFHSGHSESWSVLMRTVHSVINRTPHYILKEILLVDDSSTNKEYLKSELDYYITRFHGKVRVIRNSKSEGLIKIKSRAAKEATGEVIVFLDGHCEVNTNWLPPLLAPIYSDRTVLTVPIIDKIDHKTFEYQSIYPKNQHHRGIFDWGMQYKEKEVPQKELNNRTYKSEPYNSPTYAADLFAINREYFLSLGGYDPGLLISGGENLELSFKIWQCGGSIKWIPCSRVGHVSHTFIPFNFDKLNKDNLPFQTRNYKRIIETWFDNKYKKYFYTLLPNVRLLDIGDITDQLIFKERMQCKNFNWYMKNVAYDVFDKFPEPPSNYLWGLFCTLDIHYCLNFLTSDHHTQTKKYQTNNNQILRLNTRGQLAVGVGEDCIEADSEGVKLVKCHPGSVAGPWKFNNKTIMMHHIYQKTCMSFELRTKEISLLPCDKSDIQQKWIFKTQYVRN